MQFTLSTASVRNAVFTNESGQVLYKTSHPSKVGTFGTTTIEKIMPNADPLDMHDQFEVVGEIEWHLFGSSTFRINGKKMQSNNFLHRHGITGAKRTFTGPDGCPYRWDMLWEAMVMSRDDGSKTEVVRYQRSSLGIIGPKTLPRLDVDPDVVHMLDLIILTFVFMEKLRVERDQAAKVNNAPWVI